MESLESLSGMEFCPESWSKEIQKGRSIIHLMSKDEQSSETKSCLKRGVGQECLWLSQELGLGKNWEEVKSKLGVIASSTECCSWVVCQVWEVRACIETTERYRVRVNFHFYYASVLSHLSVMVTLLKCTLLFPRPPETSMKNRLTDQCQALLSL